MAFMSARQSKRVNSNLGIVSKNGEKNKTYRSDILNTYDQYILSTQYDDKMDWDEANIASKANYVGIKCRKPKIIYNFGKVLTNRVAAKLVGRDVFPSVAVDDDPLSEEFYKLVMKRSGLQVHLIPAMRRLGISGSAFIRFKFVMGQPILESYNSNYCYPTFSPTGELDSIKVQYVYTDEEDKDEFGKPKQKWFRIDLNTQSDIAYDNPEYDKNAMQEPDFTITERVDHGLGFVQGEWFKTSDDPLKVDGDSLLGDILGFIDELNYSLSQSSQAVSYNQDPQLWFKGMDEEDIEQLVRSSSKSWGLGRDGEAGFLESNLNGVTVADAFRDAVRLNIQDIARVVLLDPEKVVGHAQSGKAMEVLHAPMIELIDELRPRIEPRILSLLTKISLVYYMVGKSNPGILTVPAGFTPSLNVGLIWPEIFPQTMQDLRDKVQVVTSATSANLISRETGTKWLAKDFDIDNVDDEVAKIAAQPVINPFGAF